MLGEELRDVRDTAPSQTRSVASATDKMLSQTCASQVPYHAPVVSQVLRTALGSCHPGRVARGSCGETVSSLVHW